MLAKWTAEFNMGNTLVSYHGESGVVGRSRQIDGNLERQDLPFGGQRVMTTLIHRIPIKPVFLSVLIIVKIPTLGSSGIMVHKPIPSQTKE